LLSILKVYQYFEKEFKNDNINHLSAGIRLFFIQRNLADLWGLALEHSKNLLANRLPIGFSMFKLPGRLGKEVLLSSSLMSLSFFSMPTPTAPPQNLSFSFLKFF
jgi:hypothetical protein